MARLSQTTVLCFRRYIARSGQTSAQAKATRRHRVATNEKTRHLASLRSINQPVISLVKMINVGGCNPKILCNLRNRHSLLTGGTNLLLHLGHISIRSACTYSISAVASSGLGSQQLLSDS